MKWTAADYKNYKNPDQPVELLDWRPPRLVYPCCDTERSALSHLKNSFAPLPPYQRSSEKKTGMEWEASESGEFVTIDTPLPDGYIAFLENTAEQCTSPQTKHSEEGMQGARHWVQRVDTAEGIFRRLTDGYGISLMFGERFHQFIRNSNNWRGASGIPLDLDVWRDPEHPEAPEPVFSLDELFELFPILAQICSFILPSASSLHEGRPFKARGIVLFEKPITDQRVYRAFGDILCSELDCIPQNVTKNPVAVGFGNTHNAPQAWRNDAPDTEWVNLSLMRAYTRVKEAEAKRAENRRATETRQKAYKERKANGTPNGSGSGTGENISAFIERCDPVAEMVREGWLTPGKGNEYRWHESGHDRSCDILDGSLHIFSNSMFSASPHTNPNEAVGAHRFYLYQLSNLDMTKESDKPRIRQFLFERGYGSDPQAFTEKQRKPKLQRDTEQQQNPPELETLEQNAAARENATDTFLSDESEHLHILLVKDSTGTGKTHTILAKAHQHGKRTILNPPHNDLASQAVSIAYQAGFQNPFHILGREHNWEESGIADIPVSMRTADLFEKNNCIMVDEVKKYTDKRLAPRTYCEHKCAFRDGCPHLEQYKGLGQRDFLATCSPNLLFDLNMRGYLQSLVTATDEPSDEELAIDAILGTESEETTEFDLAILDDYGISGLYTDITFSESEFKALKKAWSGTPTGKFAKMMLKAFAKKKPKKIVKALRTALESIADTRDEIANALTQHAREGAVEYAERPKSSKETKRLLTEKVIKYKDGGMQFIPVDFEAYQELTKKAIPSVHPQNLQTQSAGEQVRVPHTPTHALISGIPIEDLTPVWQKGATPIELIEIFLASVCHDTNAPITRTFRAGGDNPIAILTFSIPPQAPIGVLPQIAMLSATTDIEDTKRAFDRQPVTFSEHTGGRLEWAPDVQVYQFQNARLTSASVFDYPTDADGKRLLQDAPLGLTPTAEKRLAKLNDWAKATDGLTAFISYKEFTEDFGEAVNGFDIVTHFDKVAGLNFDGLKFLVVFGYPKVSHEVVMKEARRQYASDSDPLPKRDPNLRDENGKKISEYLQLTETADYQEDGITITERRYKDPRLEKIRRQLSIEKLEQAIGRSRLPRWTDTTTLIFTNTHTAGITDRATWFSSYAFDLADTPNGLQDAEQRIKDAEDSGDVQDVMETKGVSKRTAERQTKPARKQQEAERDARIIELHTAGNSQREIERQMKNEGYTKTSRKVISRVVQKRQRQLELLIGNDANAPPSPPTDVTGVQSEIDPEPAEYTDAEICKRFSAGHSKEQIATEMKISQDTVKRVLDLQPF